VGLSETSLSQIDALTAEKVARTPDQRKVDSAVLAAAQQAEGKATEAAPQLMPTVETDGAGRTTVEVTGGVDSALLKRIEELGGEVLASHPEQGEARIALSVTTVQTLAADPQVARIRSIAAGAITSEGSVSSSAGGARHRVQGRTPDVRSAVGRAASARLRALAGSVTSEGDAVHGADAARAQFGVSGVGVTVGVLSDGVNSLQSSIAGGELPPDVRVLPGQAGSGDEGTAILQIVHDVAPKAKLMFATAFNGALGFAENIRALRAAGADIIVDDVIDFAESPFQDGPIAQAVIDVIGDGALYFSSAGNEGNLDDGTSGNYEGDFVPSGVAIGKYAGEAHDFAPGAAVQVVDPVTAGSAGLPALLHWADPLGQAADDYDLDALDTAGNVVGYSNDIQDGDDDPFESFTLPSNRGPLRLAIVKFSGESRYLQLTAFRGRFAADGALSAYSTQGVTRGHSTVPGAFSVAAAPAAAPFPRALAPGDPPNPSGPFPDEFTAAQLSERFTSDGPRRVFFTPDGAPLTPGNFSATGGQVRQKPDLTAADGVATAVPGFSRFFGTSASAPHAAAIAALVLSGRPKMSMSTVGAALRVAALDIEAPGGDSDTGRGVLLAGAALQAVGAAAQAYPLASDPIVVQSTDGDTFLEPGETATVDVPVTNEGDATALLVDVLLRSSTPGVAIVPAVQEYGNIEVGATAVQSFAVTVPAAAPPGSAVALTADVRFAGGYSPLTTQGRVVIGQPATESVQAFYTGPPVAIPDNNPTGVAVPLTFSGVGPVSGGVTFSIDGTDCSSVAGSTTVGLDHTFVRDLIGTLTAPDGTSARLFERTGGSGNNLCQVRLVDTATRSIQTAIQAENPYTGEWRPAQPLAGFQGTDADGTWLFSVSDVTAVDTGSIRSVSMTLQGYEPAPIQNGT
jgi:subtilisin-like proprotein convertase family protein